MDNDNTQPRPLPEKVVRRHAEIIEDLLPDLSRLVTEEFRPADTLLNSYLRTHRELGSRDRRFLSQAVFSYFRWYGWTINKLKLNIAEACLISAMLDSDELNQSFQYLQARCKLPDACKPIGRRSLADKIATMNEWFKDTPDFDPLEASDLVCADFNSVIDPDQLVRYIEAFQQRPPAWVRARTEPEALIKALSEHQIQAQLHPTTPSSFSVDAGISLPHLLSQQTGQFVVQDIASQCVGLVCAPQKDGDWWDCCAGSGGKAMHLIDLMQEGKVLASDIRLSALKELKKRARKHGIKSIRTQQFNAANDEPFTKTFDGVLVDAPCSGWGTWNRNPDARWRTSRRDVIQCATRQLKILSNAKWCVKPGGILVYAVCTITRPETEEVVMNFLDQHENFKLSPFTNPLTGEQTDGQLQVYPWDGPGDGMFIARFVRDED
ncbi:MAG TPA: methyltransferase domain-containing protein [Pontiella sp.]